MPFKLMLSVERDKWEEFAAAINLGFIYPTKQRPLQPEPEDYVEQHWVPPDEVIPGSVVTKSSTSLEGAVRGMFKPGDKIA